MQNRISLISFQCRRGIVMHMQLNSRRRYNPSGSESLQRTHPLPRVSPLLKEYISDEYVFWVVFSIMYCSAADFEQSPFMVRSSCRVTR